jgi:ribosomal protein L7/L12
MSDLLSSLVTLFSSPDPAQVAQGLELLEALDDPVLEERLLEGATLQETPRMVTRYHGAEWTSGLSCFSFRGPLSDTCYSHLIGLILLMRLLRRGVETAAMPAADQEVVLRADSTGLHAVRNLCLSGGTRLQSCTSPVFQSQRALLAWLAEQESWQPQATVAPRRVLGSILRQMLAELAVFYWNLPEPLRGVLLRESAEITDDVELNLFNLQLTSLPEWIRLERLSALILTGNQIHTLPRSGLDGIALTLDQAQWEHLKTKLPVVRRLTLEGLSHHADLSPLGRMPWLRHLSLTFRGAIPEGLTGCLRHLEELELLCDTPRPLPTELLSLPTLKVLSLGGFSEVHLTGSPPEGLKHLLLHGDELASATPAWQTIREEPQRREVWLLSTNMKISTIKEVRRMLGLGLKEAKILVESAPVRVTRARSLREAHLFRDGLLAAGAQIALR